MLALLAQLSPAPRDVDANVARLERALAERPEADLAVFPELFLSGYTLERLDELACAPGSAPLEAVGRAAAAAGTAVIVGFPERCETGVANALACFGDDGALAGVYRKTHLFGAEGDAFVAGDEQLVVALADATVAPLVCFDAEFPEPARAAARAGAQLLATASANMAPYAADHRLAARARALDNRLCHLYVNRVGAEGGHRFVGGSCAVAADGAVLAEAGEDREQLLTVPVDTAARPDPSVDYPRQARGELPVRSPFPSGGTP